MEKYKNKLWIDLKNDTERAEFIECGRAHETGIIAKAIEDDLAKAYRTCALTNPSNVPQANELLPHVVSQSEQLKCECEKCRSYYIPHLIKPLTISGCLYAFLYNSCVHESSWATISLHYSKEGAEKAMQEHKQKKLDEFNNMYANDNEFGFKFGEHEDWCVKPVEVLP